MHILVLPLPAQGHLNPCIATARLLVPQGFTFTIVVTEELAPKAAAPIVSEGGGEGCESSGVAVPNAIEYAVIPYTVTSATRSKSVFDFKHVLKIIDDIRPDIEALLRKLASSPRGVFCIIADFFVTWGQQLASEFNIPAFAFFVSNAHTLTALLHTHLLISKGLVPVKGPDQMIDCIPGLPPLRARDLSQSIRTYPSFAANLAKEIQRAAGVIINTIYELEKQPLDIIKSKLPIYPIGPMLPMLDRLDKPLNHAGPAASPGETVALWAEERECLTWLDTRPVSSVLFVAFGSLARMGLDQTKELAAGLEASGQAFLWVIRSDAILDVNEDEPLSELLPEGFMERTKERGLIISWAPQLDVLSHPAVGGFFTHGGWNSVTENLSLGAVPMICWPQLAEQRLSRKLVVDEWKLGLELEAVDKDGRDVVTRASVEKAVTQLMQGELGRELKKRAMELKGMVSLAVQEGGSSQNYLKALAEDIRKLAGTTTN